MAGATTCGVGVCSSDALNSRATQIEIKNCGENVGGERGGSGEGGKKVIELTVKCPKTNCKKVNCTIYSLSRSIIQGNKEENIINLVFSKCNNYSLTQGVIKCGGYNLKNPCEFSDNGNQYKITFQYLGSSSS